jgi:hypothetical protein
MSYEIEHPSFDPQSTSTNFEYVGNSPFRPNPPSTNLAAIEAHKKTILFSMAKNLYTSEVEHILTQRKRSEMNEDSLLYDFFSGDIPFHQTVKDEHYYNALDVTHTAFAPPVKCRPVHILDVEHHYPHRMPSNAEAPFSTEPFFRTQLRDPLYIERNSLPSSDPRPSFGNMKSIIFDWTRRFLHEIKNGSTFDKHLYYILLHTKTALIDIKDPNKLRCISGFPRPQNIAYIMLMWSYMAYLKRSPGLTPLLWGYETITGGWFRLNNELFRSHIRGSIITLDKSRFDKFFSFEIQDDIDQMTRSFLDFDNGYMPTKEYYMTHTTWDQHKAHRLELLWQWLCYSFRSCPTVLPDGRMYRRKWFGMPSGVYTTQLYDTIHFSITNYTVLFAMGFLLSQIILHKGQGDDIIFKLSVLIPPNEHEDFLSTYSSVDKEYFGSETRPAKCEVKNSPQNAHVLGYRNNHGMPHRDRLELLAQLYHTKMAAPTPPKTMATCVGIAYALMQVDTPENLRAYNTCKDVYDFYALQGFTPDERTFRLTFYQDVLSETTLRFDTFPQPSDIQRNLMNYSYDPPPTMKRFWPDWFTSDF